MKNNKYFLAKTITFNVRVRVTLVFLSSFQNLKQLVWPGYETITRITY